MVKEVCMCVGQGVLSGILAFAKAICQEHCMPTEVCE